MRVFFREDIVNSYDHALFWRGPWGGVGIPNSVIDSRKFAFMNYLAVVVAQD